MLSSIPPHVSHLYRTWSERSSRCPLYTMPGIFSDAEWEVPGRNSGWQCEYYTHTLLRGSEKSILTHWPSEDMNELLDK